MKKHIEVVAAIIQRDGKYLAVQRGPAKLDYISHKWEFPGGKVEEGESAEQAIIRELNEEVGILSTELTIFESLNYDYPEKSLYFDFFTVTKFESEPYGKEGQQGLWVPITDLKHYSFPEANIPVLEKVMLSFC